MTLTCYVGGCRNPKLALEERRILREIVLKDLQRLLGLKGEPTFEHYFSYPKAIPQYEVGYGKVKEVMNKIESVSKGFFFAGHYRDGISLADSILSGDNIAQKIQSYISERNQVSQPAISAT
ncbi:MAG: hemG [Verrucomicrobiales bacterium]|nr:hemG [Verrucomicrobiales bacterium]